MGDGVTYVTQFTPWGDVVLAASAQGLVALRFADQGVPERWTRASSDRPTAARLLARLLRAVMVSGWSGPRVRSRTSKTC